MRWQIGVIYFLFKDKKVVYVGKTTSLDARIGYHRTQKMDFDSFKAKQYPIEKLDEMKRIWIQYFNPIHNSQLKHEPIIKVKKKLTSIKKSAMHFRKLTEKSIIGFGQNKDRTAGEMLKRGRYRDLISMYFNLSHITFFDNILDELKITDEYRISKPGNDREKGFDFINEFYPSNEQMQNLITSKRAKTALKHLSLRNNSPAYNRSFNQKP